MLLTLPPQLALRISETGKTRVRTIQRVRRQALMPTVICWDRLTAAPVFVAS